MLEFPDITKQYPRGTAYHEAGHAVVAWSFGLLVPAVRVSDDDASGGTDIGGADTLQIVDQIAVLTAGVNAGAKMLRLAGAKIHQ